MEAGFGTDFAQADVHYGVMPGQQVKAVPYRRINGSNPYLQPGIDRDTTLSQQGTTGRLEKNGAVLMTEKGRIAYLQTEPSSGTYTGYNPLPIQPTGRSAFRAASASQPAAKSACSVLLSGQAKIACGSTMQPSPVNMAQRWRTICWCPGLPTHLSWCGMVSHWQDLSELLRLMETRRILYRLAGPNSSD